MTPRPPRSTHLIILPIAAKPITIPASEKTPNQTTESR